MNMQNALANLRTTHNGGVDSLIDLFKFHPTGSAHTCNPPILDTDEDWVVWADDFNKASDDLTAIGFTANPDQTHYGAVSMRFGKYNIILMSNKSEYDLWVKATAVCKYLNIGSKEQRKMIHRIVCGEEPV